MAVKRYIHYPSHMAELTPQKLAAANYHGYQKYVTEEDYAALEAKAYKAGTAAGELQMRVNQLEAECERLREEVYKLSPKQVLEPVDTQILDGFGRLPE